MVGIEFEESVTKTRGAYDDVFAALLTFFERVHGSPEAFDAGIGTKIPHTFGVRRGIGG